MVMGGRVQMIELIMSTTVKNWSLHHVRKVAHLVSLESVSHARTDIICRVQHHNARHASHLMVHIALNVTVIQDALSVKKDIS